MAENQVVPENASAKSAEPGQGPSPTRARAKDWPLVVDGMIEELRLRLTTIVIADSEDMTQSLAAITCARAMLDRWQVLVEAGVRGEGDFPEMSRQELDAWLSPTWREAMASAKATVLDPPPRPSAPERRVGELYRYHAGGNLILGVGIVSGVVAFSWGLAPAWAGFLAGAVPTWLLTAFAHASHDV